MLANQTFLYFSDLAKDAFVIESMAEADNNRVSKQQVEHPYGNVCVDAALHVILSCNSFYCTMHFSAKCGIVIVILSVCCLSVCLLH